MSDPVVLFDDTLNSYSFGAGHPMQPNRLRHTLALASFFGLDAELTLATVPTGTEDLSRLVHSVEYLRALRRNEPNIDFGIGTVEHPISTRRADGASHIVAGTVEAARMVWSGEARRVVNLAGGLHHAQPARQSGFCALNDVAVAISWLLRQGAQRIAYVDFDAHHGDGVEAMFWDDPRVLTISIHESGIYLFPYTGFPNEIGADTALGTAVNIALPPESGDSEWLEAIHGIVPQLLRAFRPEIVFSQHGADTHFLDPLTHLKVSVEAEANALRSLSAWVDQFAGGNWVAVGGGGYNLDSVARVWFQVLAATAGVEVSGAEAMPADWSKRLDVPGATRLGDLHGESAHQLGLDFHPGKLTRSKPSAFLVATSKAVFPYWGLTPYG
ncbi:acetoin utilization protein AcuC [Corynebacterium lubricantis]|uniref:acetoin utilization protein AcuC n=1 Tax=Corynebacterium lubricantis TaxID=541095 RepID=UPI000369506B|nr:acetoin utilization protein AcuC [Corynebacterium lubricantis]